MSDPPKWRLTGDWFDVCRCRVPCACTFAQAPDEGECNGILAWHINEGSFGDVNLDDLSVVAIGAFEGNIWAGEAQNSNEEVVGIEYAPIEFELADDLSGWRVEVPGRARGRAEALVGPTSPETPVTVHNAPGAEVGPGQVATYATAAEDEVEAFGFKWSWPGRSSKHFPFDWSGPDAA